MKRITAFLIIFSFAYASAITLVSCSSSKKSGKVYSGSAMGSRKDSKKKGVWGKNW